MIFNADSISNFLRVCLFYFILFTRAVTVHQNYYYCRNYFKNERERNKFFLKRQRECVSCNCRCQCERLLFGILRPPNFPPTHSSSSSIAALFLLHPAFLLLLFYFFFFWNRLNWLWMARAAFSVSGASRSMSISSSPSWVGGLDPFSTLAIYKKYIFTTFCDWVLNVIS